MAEHRSRRPRFFVAAAGILAVACLYLSFELGRYQAGFSLFDEREQIMALTETIAEKDARIDELQRQTAILQTSGEIDAETYTAVEAELAALQVRIQGLEEELAFYQGIVSPGDRVAGLRIQNVEVAATPALAQPWALRLLLVQSIVHDDRVTGTVRVSINGAIDGEDAAFGLHELDSEDQQADIPYGFRYFQSLERSLTLPEGFVPAQLQIEIWPTEPRGDTLTQYYPWSQVAGG